MNTELTAKFSIIFFYWLVQIVKDWTIDSRVGQKGPPPGLIGLKTGVFT